MQPTAPYALYVVPYLRIFIVKTLLYVFKAWGTTHKDSILTSMTYITRLVLFLGMENARIPIVLIGLSERILLGNRKLMKITAIPIAVITHEQ